MCLPSGYLYVELSRQTFQSFKCLNKYIHFNYEHVIEFTAGKQIGQLTEYPDTLLYL